MENRETHSLVQAESCQTDDWACSGMGLLWWGLPVVALILGARWESARPWLWVPGFLLAGVACLANAASCKRVHCYFTGPVYLLAAAYVVLAGFHLLPMNPNVFLAAVVFLTLLAHAAEIPLGRYRKRA